MQAGEGGGREWGEGLPFSHASKQIGSAQPTLVDLTQSSG